MKRTPLTNRLKNLGMLILAVILYSIGVSFFFGPSGLTPGGLSGVSIALERLRILPFGKGIIVLILNIPIVILGIVKFGPKFFATTISAILTSSGLMEVLDFLIEKFDAGYTISPLPAAVGGGVLIGISVGLAMRAGATFGGTDIVVKVLRLRYKYMQTGTFYLFVDGAIVVFGTLCALFASGSFEFQNFDVEILIYSVMAIFVQSYFANFVLYGSEGARKRKSPKESTENCIRALPTCRAKALTRAKTVRYSCAPCASSRFPARGRSFCRRIPTLS